MRKSTGKDLSAGVTQDGGGSFFSTSWFGGGERSSAAKVKKQTIEGVSFNPKIVQSSEEIEDGKSDVLSTSRSTTNTTVESNGMSYRDSDATEFPNPEYNKLVQNRLLPLLQRLSGHIDMIGSHIES